MDMRRGALRRLTFEEPVSRLAIWARRLALLSLALALLGLLAAHAHGGFARLLAILSFSSGRLPEPGLGFFLYVLGLVMAVLALLVGAGAAGSIWMRGRRGAGKLIATALLLTFLLPYPVYLMISGENPPWIADIATDAADPPGFSASREALAARSGWTPAPFDASRFQRQAAAYPDVRTIVLDMSADEAFRAARQAVDTLHWKLVEETHPGGAQRDGRIEAMAFTPGLRAPRAISIRIRSDGDESHVDARIVTRYLPNDFGAGAEMIGELRDILEEKDES